MKLYSWNVNGLRSVLKKGALQQFLDQEHPDVLCLQETKAKRNQVEVDFPDYTEYWNSAARPGYSGTATLVKNGLEVLSSTTELPPALTEKYQLSRPDQYGAPSSEGRVQTLEFADFYLVNIYTPNSKRDLSRLALREHSWDPAIREYLQGLSASDSPKSIVVCGDFNAAHAEIDLARPKDNQKNAGFTPEERQGITNLIEAGFLDTFRTLHPETQRYTWWSHWSHAREKNIGWRIDYFFVSSSLGPRLQSAEIYEHYTGSDHCPISIELDF